MQTDSSIGISKYIIYFCVTLFIAFALLEFFCMIIQIIDMDIQRTVAAVFLGAFISMFIVKIGKTYLLLFFALALIFAVVLILFPNIGIFLGAVACATILTVSKLIQEYHRVPNEAEKTNLVRYSTIALLGVIFVIALIISLLFGGIDGVLTTFHLVTKNNIFNTIGRLAFILFSSYMILSYGYGDLANIILDKREDATGH